MAVEGTTEQLNGQSFEARVLAQLASINSRLDSLEKQAERKALETKPVWERALTEIIELRREMRDGFEAVEDKISVLNDDVLKLRAQRRLTVERPSERADATSEPDSR
jgi:arginine/lysine/ornithine decarboxylase